MRALAARRPALVPVIAAVLMLVLAVGGVAGAAGEPSLVVRSVDARDDRLAVDVVNTGPAKPSGLEVRVDGREVDAEVASFAEAGRSTNVVVVLDNSTSSGNGAVQIAKQQLQQLAPGTNNIANLGVVSIGRTARLAVPLTSSPASVSAAVRYIQPTGAPALWDGIVMAADELAAIDPTGSSQIVVITSAADAVSRKGYPAVEEALRRSGSSLKVVALSGGTADEASLQKLVDLAGGSLERRGSNDFETYFARVAESLGAQYRITAPAPGPTDAALVDLSVSWSGAEVQASFPPEAWTSGATALRPVGDDRSLLDRLVDSPIAKWLMVILGTASAGMLVYSVAMLITRRKDGLDFALRHYDGYVQEDSFDDGFGDENVSLAGKNQFLRKAVAVTGNLAQRQGFLAKIEDLLEKADLPLRPAEALFFYGAGVSIAAIAAAVLSGDFLVLVMVVLIALLAPNFIVKFRAKRRQKKFVGQLPDMLQLLAGTLRAGYSIAQGFEAVSHEIADPMGRELRRVMAEARLGRPIEEALEAAAERTQSDDFAWAVMAIRIQREVGGNLAELLLTVAETMTQRERLRRDVSALTAEGRMSAMVLGLLPPGLAGVMWVMNPDYIGRLTEDTMGLVLLSIAAVSMLIGFAWMKKIINIEI